MIVQAESPETRQDTDRPSYKTFRAWRFAVWLRDDFRCVYCGQDLIRDYQTLFTATIDHLMPKSAGGGYDQANLVTCCYSCNNLKAGKKVESIEEGRKIIAHRRSMIAGLFIEQAEEHGVQFPRQVDAPDDEMLLTFETLNALHAFVHAARQVSGGIKAIGKRALKVDECLSKLDSLRELFGQQPDAELSPDKLASV